jgi:hypothetical protein
VPKRYYVVVERNTCGKEPNIQIEVGIRVQPVPPYFVLYDHYSDANVISGNPTTTCAPPYPNIALPAGTYTGCEGDLTCTTKDPTDQNTCGVRTIWYKFISDVTGWMYISTMIVPELEVTITTLMTYKCIIRLFLETLAAVA